MKHLIFLVHGVGNTSPGWSDDLKKLLGAQYAKYPRLAQKVPFTDDNYEIVEINYNGVFEKQRQRWAADANEVTTALSGGGLIPAGVNKLLQASSDLGKDGFLRTHALDVVFYRFFPDLAEAVRATVNEQLLDHLLGLTFGSQLRWSVVAHSLGTAVIHDTLHAMFEPGEGARDSEGFQPENVFMVSNTSRLLENTDRFGPDGDVYRSFLRPNVDPLHGCCRSYINIRNGFDPICAPSRFMPADDWPDTAARTEGRYQEIKFALIEDDLKVHDFSNYLANPAVHVPLFRTLSGVPSLINKAEADAAMQQYNAQRPIDRIKADDLSLIKSLILADHTRDWPQIIAMLFEAQKLFTR